MRESIFDASGNIDFDFMLLALRHLYMHGQVRLYYFRMRKVDEIYIPAFSQQAAHA